MKKASIFLLILLVVGCTKQVKHGLPISQRGEIEVPLKEVPKNLLEAFRIDYPNGVIYSVSKIKYFCKGLDRSFYFYSIEYIMDAEQMHFTSYCLDEEGKIVKTIKENPNKGNSGDGVPPPQI